MDEELAGSHPPTSRCPRLHALAILPAPGPTPGPVPPSLDAVAEARLRALGLLSMVLGGDDLAAEYLLLQLVGRWVPGPDVFQGALIRAWRQGAWRIAARAAGYSSLQPPTPRTHPCPCKQGACTEGGRRGDWHRVTQPDRVPRRPGFGSLLPLLPGSVPCPGAAGSHAALREPGSDHLPGADWLWYWRGLAMWQPAGAGSCPEHTCKAELGPKLSGQSCHLPDLGQSSWEPGNGGALLGSAQACA